MLQGLQVPLFARNKSPRSVGRKWFRNNAETNHSEITSLNGRIRRIAACVERMFTQGVFEDNRKKNPSSMTTVLCVSAGSRPRFDGTKYQGRNVEKPPSSFSNVSRGRTDVSCFHVVSTTRRQTTTWRAWPAIHARLSSEKWPCPNTEILRGWSNAVCRFQRKLLSLVEWRTTKINLIDDSNFSFDVSLHGTNLSHFIC